MTEVGSPRARKEGGDRRQPSRRAVSAPPQPPPDNVDIASSGAPETSKDGQGMATGARTEKRNGRSAQDAGPKNRQPFPPPPPRRTPMDDRSTSWTNGRKKAAMAGSSTSWGKGRLYTPFPAVSQLLPVLQIHYRFHADICTHFISLLYGI